MGIAMRGSVNVDVSHALAVCSELQEKLSKKNFDLCLEITVRDTGNRAVKRIIKQEIPPVYEVTSGWVGSKVMAAQFSGGGGSVRCIIPVKGERGTLGGIFPAGGGGRAKGRAKMGKQKKKLKRGGSNVTATILRGKTSALPGTLPNQGGNPPFRHPSGLVMTRKTSASHPIVRVVGRAVPQMVDKHFEARIQSPINEYMIKRMSQVVSWKMGI